jgi:hypothetical protein
MYYRNPDYFDVERRSKMAGAEPDAKPLTLPTRLLLSLGMILAPVLVIFLALGIGRLVSSL